MLSHAQELIDFIEKSPSAFQGCENVKKELSAAGFAELLPSEQWQLEKGGKYFITKNDSSITAFVYGEKPESGFIAAAAHLDSPCIALKPNSEAPVENSYIKLNTEVYGGAILSSWLDRPLSLCGRVMLSSANPLKPISKFINIHKPLMVIPNLAIHLNRDINNGYKYSKQKDMSPLLCIIKEGFEKNDYLIRLLCDELNADSRDILDFELYLYEYSKGCITGLDNEFISASRLDDLMMCFNILRGFLADININTDKTRLIYFSDNEEIGSETSQGAKSSFLKDTLKRICLSSENKEAYYIALENSVIISADLAHGMHPSHSDKTDPTNRPVLGSGVCLKYSAAQKYSTNSSCGAVFTALCRQAQIKMQKFANHSDIAGGTTIGPMLAEAFAVPVIDMGAPILSMHSIRELASVSDNYDCLKLFRQFFKP